MAAEDLDGLLMLAADREAPRWARADYERILLNPPSEPLLRCGMVALSDGSLAGFAVATFLPQETWAELEALFVDRAYRRQGIARGLVAACIAWAGKAGATVIRLEVRASNAAALALYQRFGFSSVGVRRGYYSIPVEDAVLLQARVPL